MPSYVMVPMALLAVSLLSASAQADTLVVSGEGSTYTFTLPASPTVNTSNLGDFFTTFPTSSDNVSNELGFGSATYAEDLGFIENSAVSVIGFSGPQLYSGSEAAPTLLTGTFALIDQTDGESYTATITSSVSPEPSSFLLLGTGLAGLTAIYRRKRLN